MPPTLRTPEPTAYEIKLFDPLEDANFPVVSIDHIHQYTQKDPDSQIQALLDLKAKIVENHQKRLQDEIASVVKDTICYAGVDSFGNPYNKYFFSKGSRRVRFHDFCAKKGYSFAGCTAKAGRLVTAGIVIFTGSAAI